jgi:hypothetical protein
MLALRESAALVALFLAITSFSDTRFIYAGPFGGLLPYISDIRNIPVQGGNEVWGEFF